MKKILILGSNTGSLEMVEYIRRRGDYAIVSDFYQMEQSPAKQLAHEHWEISTQDLELLYGKCLEENVQGILASTGEANLESAIKLSGRLGLPFYVDEKSWKYTNDKLLFKQACMEHGLPVPQAFSLTDLPEDADYPVVVKPADNCFSRGLTVCENKEALPEAIALAEKYSGKKRVVIEKYIEGIQLNAGYYMADGEIELSDVFGSFVGPGEPSTCYSFFTTKHRYETMYLEKYNEKVKQLLKDLGCRNGKAFIQGIVQKDTLYMLEVNYRLDGMGMFNLGKEAYGLDSVKLLVDYSADGKTSMPKIPPNRKTVTAAYAIWTRSEGTISRIYGLERLKEKIPNVRIRCMFREGMTVSEARENGRLLMTIAFIKNSEAEVEETVKWINRNVGVLDQEGKDMLIRFEAFDQI